MSADHSANPDAHPGPSFAFESSDSIARFTLFIIPFVGGGVVGAVAFDLGTLETIALVSVIWLLLIAGLRASISIGPNQVRIVRKWFFVPYRIYTAPRIDDVWFGGDYGDEEGAAGVVVSMAGKEIHIGTSKNMHFLHKTLAQFTERGKATSRSAAAAPSAASPRR